MDSINSTIEIGRAGILDPSTSINERMSQNLDQFSNYYTNNFLGIKLSASQLTTMTDSSSLVDFMRFNNSNNMNTLRISQLKLSA